MSSKVKGNTGSIYNTMRDRLYRAHRTYVRFFQIYFSKRLPGDYRWLPNHEETEIWITGQSPDKLESPHNRPLISVVRAQAQWASTSHDGLRNQSLLNNNRTFTDVISSTMILNCMAKEAVEAQDIAWLAFTGLRIFKNVVIHYGRLHGLSNSISMMPISAPGQIVPGPSFSDWRLVQIYSPFTVQETISVTEDDEADFKILAKDLIQTVTIVAGPESG